MESFDTYVMVNALLENNAVFVLVGGTWSTINIAKVSTIASVTDNL